MPPTGCQCPLKLGAGIALAALHLGMLRDQLPGATIEIGHDGLTLGVEAKAGLALLVCRYPVIGDKPAEMRAQMTLQRCNPFWWSSGCSWRDVNKRVARSIIR